MLRRKIFKSKFLSLALIWAFFILLNPAGVWTQSTTQVGSLKGAIYEDDFESRVEDAVVKLRNILTGKEYKSEPTDNNGAYEIKNIEQGRYVIGIITQEGDYNFEFEVYIKANEEGLLNIALEPGIIGAALAEKKKKAGFFLTPVGIGVVALLLAGTTVGLVTAGGADTTVGSPAARKSKY